MRTTHYVRYRRVLKIAKAALTIIFLILNIVVLLKSI